MTKDSPQPSSRKVSLRRGTLLVVAVGIAHQLWCSPWLSLFHLRNEYVVCSSARQQVYLVDNNNSLADCFRVKHTKFHDVGSLAEITGRLPRVWATGKPFGIRVHYIPQDAMVVPGISDSHVHLLEYGAQKILPLDSGKSEEQVVALVKIFILANPDVKNNRSAIIEGFGWDQTIWPTRWPTSDSFEADPVTRHRRIILQSKDGHALWVSKQTMKDNAPYPNDVPGGVIQRDDSGNPSGVFIDDAALLIKRAVLTEEERRKRFDLTVADALSNGLTSVHDAGFNPHSLEFFRKEASLRQLPIRLYGMSFFDTSSDYWGNSTPKIHSQENSRLTARSVKMYADGSLRARGAALYEPYEDDSANAGFMRLSNDVLEDIIPLFLKDGWQVNVHAIGDLANGLILGALKRAANLHDLDLKSLRPRIEHAQIIRPQDALRLGELGVIASIQPTHVVDDMWYAKERLGPDRIRNLYPFRTIINSTARITLGSDMPVSTLNPMYSFHAAITRLSVDGSSPEGPGGYFPEQRLNRIEALRGITIDPAYASFSEGWLGSIEIGKRADYVVLSQDIMHVPVDDILRVKVLATAIDGQVVYGKV